MDSLFALNAEGITIVMVTHDKELAARTGRNIRMRDGRIES
jgi:predicted ABC-type transport system involved in lysophospholipase L1 biosynthesis ATPase subunit